MQTVSTTKKKKKKIEKILPVMIASYYINIDEVILSADANSSLGVEVGWGVGRDGGGEGAREPPKRLFVNYYAFPATTVHVGCGRHFISICRTRVFIHTSVTRFIIHGITNLAILLV